MDAENLIEGNVYWAWWIEEYLIYETFNPAFKYGYRFCQLNEELVFYLSDPQVKMLKEADN